MPSFIRQTGGGGGAGSNAPPVVGATLAALGSGEFDGQEGLVRIGSYPDLHEVAMIWDGTNDRWVQAQPHVAMTTRDTWGLDLSNRALADFRNAWCRLYSGLPYGKDACSFLFTTQNLASLASNELLISNSANFASSGTVRVRDQVLTYTGKASGKLTGVSAGSGTFPLDVTPVTQGEIGGWGTTAVPLDQVDAMYAAGFELEERANGWLNGSHDEISMSVAPYYLNVDSDESFSLPPSPPSGGLGLGVILTGPASPGAGVTTRNVERPFTWTDSGWDAFAAGTPTDRFLIPALYARMNDAAADDNGEVYGYTLQLRWVGTP